MKKGGEIMANYSSHDEYYLHYKVKIHGLTEEQKHLIERLSDVRRFTYNWFLEYSNERFEECGERFKGYHYLSNKITELRNSEEYSWLKDYNLCAMRGGLRDLNRAFMRFRLKQCRFPKFKSKRRDQVRFESRADRFSLHGENGRYAFIPGLSQSRDDYIDIGNHRIPFNGKDIKYRDVHVKFDGISYWLCVTVKAIIPIVEDEPYIHENDIVGIDVGVRTAATLSNGITYQGPDPHRLSVLYNRRSKLAAAVGRDRRRRLKESMRTRTKYDDIPKSKNQIKREKKLLKTYIKIANTYNTRYHQIAADIANQHYSAIVLETLRVKHLLQNHRGRQTAALFESRLYKLGEFISYKCTESGTVVIRAEDGYKSSQICSKCGNEYPIGKEETYVCPHCHMEMNRDLNAAINLRNYGISQIHTNPNGLSTYGALSKMY